MNNKEILLEMKHIHKSFPGVLALQDAKLTVYKSSVTALLGENGAGKSTLVKILSGIYSADSGEIVFDNKRVAFKDVRQASNAGIAIIHQELNLIPHLNVAENLFLGKEIVSKFGRLDKKRMIDETKKFLEKVNISIDPNIPVKNLSIAVRQMIEIAKALAANAKLIIMDEPTSSLMDKDVSRLFELIRQLKNEGKSIIYISHRLNEIFEICDDVTVMRDGRWIAQYDIKQTNEEQLIENIAGRKFENHYPFIAGNKKGIVLEFKNIVGNNIKANSGCFYAGETVGLSGLVGSGRSELTKAIFGAYPYTSGQIFLDGKEIKISSPKQAIQKGIVYLSEDRKGDGLNLSLSVRYNATLSALKLFTETFCRINQNKERVNVEQFVEKLHIKTPSIEQLVKNLSGGNQQKVAIARALEVKPRVLMLDEPTRGIDVGAKEEIYNLINKLKAEGLAIVMISSDLNEILGMSDRIMVFCEGAISGIIERKDADSEKIMRYAVNLSNREEVV